MIPLHAAGRAFGIHDTIVGRVQRPGADPEHLVVEEARALNGARTETITLTSGAGVPVRAAGPPRVEGLPSLEHLETGDIVAVHPSGRVDTLFRTASPNNSLFVTERCNSRCLMCSQPPRAVDDIDYFFSLNTALVSMLPRTLPTLGMTGGEPTLLGAKLVELVRHVTSALPATQLEILSNGRALSRRAFAEEVAGAASERTLFTIPLYSDHAPQHDYVVQARGAFAQTVIGLHHLARYGVRAEIRVVLHRQSVGRLPALARFIHRNLPFVEHVALMGMEHTGYARLHDDLLWIEPQEYAGALQESADYLEAFGIPVSLYNLQHCLVPRALWPRLRTAISDWKREYLPGCDGCSLRSACGGVFGTSRRQSAYLRAIPTPA